MNLGHKDADKELSQLSPKEKEQLLKTASDDKALKAVKKKIATNSMLFHPIKNNPLSKTSNHIKANAQTYAEDAKHNYKQYTAQPEYSQDQAVHHYARKLGKMSNTNPFICALIVLGLGIVAITMITVAILPLTWLI